MKRTRKASEQHIPIMRGYISERGSLIVQCPYCDEPHAHGYDPSDGLSHRRPHCNLSKDNPFKKTGYFIAKLRKRDMRYK